MFNLISLLAAVALVSMQSNSEVHAQLGESTQGLDNNIPNMPTARRRVVLRKFLFISEPPLASVRHILGTHLELNCKAVGFPIPSIHWLKNGKPMDDYNEQPNEIPRIMEGSIAILHSKLIVIPQPGDVYTCVATSEEISKEQSASTTVVGVEGDESLDSALAYQKLYAVQPHILTYYDDVFVKGSTLVLLCRVYSYGPKQVTWEKSNKIIYENDKYRILPSGDLLINDVQWTDMGEYTCTAKNLYGKDTISTFVYPTAKQ